MSKLRYLRLVTFVLLASTAAGQPSLTASRENKNSQAAEPVATFTGHTAAVTGLAFSPDGRRLSSASSNDIRIWNLTTGQEIGALKGIGGEVIAFSSDGKHLAIAGREKVTIHDAADGKELLNIEPHGDWDKSFPFRPAIASVAFGADGRWLATAGSVAKVGGRHGLPGGVVTIWDAKTGRAVHRFDKLSTGACAVSFSPDGKLVAAGTNGAGGELPEPGEVWVWDIEEGKALQTFKTRKEADFGEFISAADVAFSPDGKWVAAAVSAGGRGRPAGLLIDDKASTVRIWELASGRDVLTLRGHATGIGRVAFSPDGKRLAATGGDRAVRVWSTATGKEIKTLPFDASRIESIAFSPDGLRLAAGAGGPNRSRENSKPGEIGKPGEIKVWALDKDSSSSSALPDEDTAENAGTEGNGNVVVGPDYKIDPDLTDRANPKGKHFEVSMRLADSKIFPGDDRTLDPKKPVRQQRKIFVYVPAAYEDGTKAPLLVSLDGPNRLNLVCNALDNLTISKDPDRRLPAFIAIAVENGGDDGKGSERGLEYDTLSDRFARFINDEVLPAVLNHAEIKAAYPNIAFTENPWGKAAMGCSSGGAAALTMGWFRPDLFRRLITYSGTFVDQQDDDAPEEADYPLGAWEYHSSRKLIENSEKKPLRIFTHVSENDNRATDPEETYHNWVMANERTAAALRAKSYDYRYVFSRATTHCDSKVFEQTLADTLVWMWRGYPAEGGRQ